jgi:ribonuclease P protein component
MVVAATGEKTWSRLGLTVSRRVGGAVARNRAKRLLRETFRVNKPREIAPCDLVIVAKAGLAETSRQEVEREFRERLRRLARRWPPAPRGPAAPVAH